jgi:hypothetical protein
MEILNTINTLRNFVHQKPGLEYCNYGDVKTYRREMYEITKDLHDFRELLSYAIQRVNNLDDKIKAYLERSSGRLTINKDGQLQYITGQYFPTEYRPAAARVLADIIWADYRDEKRDDGTNVYDTGHDIRKALSKWLSRRIMKYYFN